MDMSGLLNVLPFPAAVAKPRAKARVENRYTDEALLVQRVQARDPGQLAAVAAHQVVLQLWSFLALVLDSLAIAAQSLVGAALGAGDPGRARSV